MYSESEISRRVYLLLIEQFNPMSIEELELIKESRLGAYVELSVRVSILWEVVQDIILRAIKNISQVNMAILLNNLKK
jgi:hypothetical protein